MSPKLSPFGLALALSLITAANGMAQQGANDEPPVKPTGPAAKKADDLIRAYTARIEKEIEQDRKDVERLRTELHELIDVRDAMAEAIAELRGDLATKGKYSGEQVVRVQATANPPSAPAPGPQFRSDFVYGLGSALPKEPTEQQREQLRRLAPRADLKRMIARLREEVDGTRIEVDQLAYTLLELGSGITRPFLRMGGMGGGMGGMGGGMGGMGGGMGGMGGGPFGPWFGSMGAPRGVGGGMR
jgi:hypothetical protein